MAIKKEDPKVTKKVPEKKLNDISTISFDTIASKASKYKKTQEKKGSDFDFHNITKSLNNLRKKHEQSTKTILKQTSEYNKNRKKSNTASVSTIKFDSKVTSVLNNIDKNVSLIASIMKDNQLNKLNSQKNSITNQLIEEQKNNTISEAISLWAKEFSLNTLSVDRSNLFQSKMVENEKKTILSTAIAAYKFANDEDTLSVQEKMLKAMMDMSKSISGQDSVMKIIADRILIEHASVRAMVFVGKLLQRKIAFPFKAYKWATKSRGGYSGKLPRGLGSAEHTASVLDMIYVDSMWRLDNITFHLKQQYNLWSDYISHQTGNTNDDIVDINKGTYSFLPKISKVVKSLFGKWKSAREMPEYTEYSVTTSDLIEKSNNILIAQKNILLEIAYNTRATWDSSARFGGRKEKYKESIKKFGGVRKTNADQRLEADKYILDKDHPDRLINWKAENKFESKKSAIHEKVVSSIKKIDKKARDKKARIETSKLWKTYKKSSYKSDKHAYEDEEFNKLLDSTKRGAALKYGISKYTDRKKKISDKWDRYEKFKTSVPSHLHSSMLDPDVDKQHQFYKSGALGKAMLLPAMGKIWASKTADKTLAFGDKQKNKAFGLVDAFKTRKSIARTKEQLGKASTSDRLILKLDKLIRRNDTLIGIQRKIRNTTLKSYIGDLKERALKKIKGSWLYKFAKNFVLPLATGIFSTVKGMLFKVIPSILAFFGIKKGVGLAKSLLFGKNVVDNVGKTKRVGGMFSKIGSSKIVQKAKAGIAKRMPSGVKKVAGKVTSRFGKKGASKFMSMGTKALGKALVVADVAIDGFRGYRKAKEWGVSKTSATLGGIVGGTGSGLSGAAFGAMKGATIGSVIPVIGTFVGGIAGAIAGAIGGKRLSKVMSPIVSSVKFLVSSLFNALLFPLKIIKWIGSAIKKAGSVTWNTLKNIPKKIGEWVSNLVPNWAKSLFGIGKKEKKVEKGDISSKVATFKKNVDYDKKKDKLHNAYLASMGFIKDKTKDATEQYHKYKDDPESVHRYLNKNKDSFMKTISTKYHHSKDIIKSLSKSDIYKKASKKYEELKKKSSKYQDKLMDLIPTHLLENVQKGKKGAEEKLQEYINDNPYVLETYNKSKDYYKQAKKSSHEIIEKAESIYRRREEIAEKYSQAGGSIFKRVKDKKDDVLKYTKGMFESKGKYVKMAGADNSHIDKSGNLPPATMPYYMKMAGADNSHIAISGNLPPAMMSYYMKMAGADNSHIDKSKQTPYDYMFNNHSKVSDVKNSSLRMSVNSNVNMILLSIDTSVKKIIELIGKKKKKIGGMSSAMMNSDMYGEYDSTSLTDAFKQMGRFLLSIIELPTKITKWFGKGFLAVLHAPRNLIRFLGNTIKDKIKSIYTHISNSISSFISNVKKTIHNIISAPGRLLKAIGNKIIDIKNSITNKIMGGVNFVKDKINSSIDWSKEKYFKTKKRIIDIVYSVLDKFFEIKEKASAALAKTISSIKEKYYIVKKRMIDGISWTVDKLKQGLSLPGKGVKFVSDKIKKLVNNIVDKVTAFKDYIINKVTNFFKATWDIITWPFRKIKEAFNWGRKKVIGLLGGTVDEKNGDTSKLVNSLNTLTIAIINLTKKINGGNVSSSSSSSSSPTSYSTVQNGGAKTTSSGNYVPQVKNNTSTDSYAYMFGLEPSRSIKEDIKKNQALRQKAIKIENEKLKKRFKDVGIPDIHILPSRNFSNQIPEKDISNQIREIKLKKRFKDAGSSSTKAIDDYHKNISSAGISGLGIGEIDGIKEKKKVKKSLTEQYYDLITSNKDTSQKIKDILKKYKHKMVEPDRFEYPDAPKYPIFNDKNIQKIYNNLISKQRGNERNQDKIIGKQVNSLIGFSPKAMTGDKWEDEANKVDNNIIEAEAIAKYAVSKGYTQKNKNGSVDVDYKVRNKIAEEAKAKLDKSVNMRNMVKQYNKKQASMPPIPKAIDDYHKNISSAGISGLGIGDIDIPERRQQSKKAVHEHINKNNIQEKSSSPVMSKDDIIKQHVRQEKSKTDAIGNNIDDSLSKHSDSITKASKETNQMLQQTVSNIVSTTNANTSTTNNVINNGGGDGGGSSNNEKSQSYDPNIENILALHLL